MMTCAPDKSVSNRVAHAWPKHEHIGLFRIACSYLMVLKVKKVRPQIRLSERFLACATSFEFSAVRARGGQRGRGSTKYFP
eukprot:1585689-Pyramimonas_sp.AAC.1